VGFCEGIEPGDILCGALNVSPAGLDVRDWQCILKVPARAPFDTGLFCSCRRAVINPRNVGRRSTVGVADVAAHDAGRVAEQCSAQTAA